MSMLQNKLWWVLNILQSRVEGIIEPIAKQSRAKLRWVRTYFRAQLSRAKLS